MELQKRNQNELMPDFQMDSKQVKTEIVVKPNQCFKHHQEIMIDAHESVHQIIDIIVHERGELDFQLTITVLGSYFPQVTVTMQGSHSRATIRLFLRIYKTGSVSLITKQLHGASHSMTNLLCKAVVADIGQMSHQGIVHIPQKVSSCEAFETTKIVLLGDQAQAYAEPQLEIENNEVICAHGSAIGRFDDEQIFYLACRGIAAPQIEQLLVDAFFKE